jgi:hypothetical protein
MDDTVLIGTLGIIAVIVVTAVADPRCHGTLQGFEPSPVPPHQRSGHPGRKLLA